MKINIKTTGLALFFGLSVAAHATLVTDQYTAEDGTVFTPPGGTSNFLEIEADGNYRFTLTLGGNKTFGGYFAFDSKEPIFSTYIDSASVSVFDGATLLKTWSEQSSPWVDTGLKNSYGFELYTHHVDWQSWQFTNPDDYAKVFTFTYTVSNDGGQVKDGDWNSVGLFAAVPEPSTWVVGALLATFMSITTIRNHRKLKQA